MKPIPIQVQCHSEHKRDQSPQRFVCEGAEIEIEEVLDQWLSAGRDPKQCKADYFKVVGTNGHDYLLKHALDSDEWFLENRW